MVAACRYALLVEVLDAAYDPMAADPDTIEAPFRARRVLPPPSSVGDGKGPARLTSLKQRQVFADILSLIAPLWAPPAST